MKLDHGIHLIDHENDFIDHRIDLIDLTIFDVSKQFEHKGSQDNSILQYLAIFHSIQQYFTVFSNISQYFEDCHPHHHQSNC